MIKANEISLSFGIETLYESCSFQIQNGEKVGIVGVNGAGKTTLFRLLLNELELDKGTLTFNEKHLGYLSQEIVIPEENMTVYEYLFAVRPITNLEKKLSDLYSLISDKEDPLILKNITRIQDELDYLNQYNAEDDLFKLFEETNTDISLLSRKIKELSGGQKSRIKFLQLIFSKPEILMLDEPTNHLDKDSRDMIIDYLKKFNGTVLIISHDIDFLNSLVDNILFINKATHKIKKYKGDYYDFKSHYAEEMMLKELRIEQQEREIEKLKDIVKRASEASRICHKLKRMGKVKEKVLQKKLANLETRDQEYRHVKMKINPSTSSGKVPLEVKDLSFHYDGFQDLYKDLSFSLSKNERFLIVGENGIGKSTLLKLIIGQLKPQQGEIFFSQKTTISYYAQELEKIDKSKTVFENVHTGEYSDSELRSYLGNFLFSNDDIYKKASVLSPGERARLMLCKTILEKNNFLILDEPTNHLDPETQKIIGENFKDFAGTLLVVSHNPKFVETLGITRMLLLPEGKIMNYSPELLKYYYYLNTDI